jgi:predicted MFS family arabinose efflux permease
MSRVKRFSLAVCAALAIIGMLLLFAGKSYFIVLIGALVSGFAYALYAPVNITRTVQQAQPGTMPMAIAAVNASGNLGLFLTAFAVVGMTGNLGISYKEIFGYAALFLIVPVILALPGLRRKINANR